MTPLLESEYHQLDMLVQRYGFDTILEALALVFRGLDHGTVDVNQAARENYHLQGAIPRNDD